MKFEDILKSIIYIILPIFCVILYIKNDDFAWLVYACLIIITGLNDIRFNKIEKQLESKCLKGGIKKWD